MKLAHAQIAAALLCGTSGLAAQSVIYEWVGEGPNSATGRALGSADIDGDGIRDIVVGAPLDDSTLTDSGAVLVYSGFNDVLLHRKLGTFAGGNLGWSVAGLGDIDGDGFNDFAAGGLYENITGPESGAVHVYSGATGAQLYLFPAPLANSLMGFAVADAGDIDLDGSADVIAGAPYEDLVFTNAGSVRVYSGATGLALHTWHGDDHDNNLGISASCAGDVNQDGVPDVVAGCRRPLNGTNTYTRVFSGLDGQILLNVFGSTRDDKFGWSTDGIGDIDLDGIPDLAASAPYADEAGTDAGKVRVLSGATGQDLYVLLAAGAGDNLGYSLSRALDHNADGIPDLIAGANQPFNGGSGYARVYSGADGSILQQINGVGAGDWFGRAVSFAGDIDGDGYCDVSVGAPAADKLLTNAGTVQVVSGRVLPMTTDSWWVSKSAGGTQTLAVNAGAQHAGKFYFVLGTTSGTTFGFDLGAGLVLPLNIDSYTNFTLLSPNSAPLTGSLGVLGAGGKATCTFSVPAGTTGLPSNLTLHHALVVLDPLSIALISTAIPVFLAL